MKNKTLKFVLSLRYINFILIINLIGLLSISSVTFSNDRIDLTNATIVATSESSFNMSAARFLQQEIFIRTGISLKISEELPQDQTPAILLSNKKTFLLPKALSVPARPESYAIWVDLIQRTAPTVMVIGRDNKGTLFAAGKLIQFMTLSENYISLDKNLALAQAPVDKIRAQQIITNTQSEDGFMDWENFDDVSQFIRDMILTGTNGFEPTEPELVDEYLEELGIDLFIKLKCQDIIDFDLKSDTELINLYTDLTGIDHITTYGGDASGAVNPMLFFPQMERVLPLILTGQPDVKWWYSNQCLDDHAKDYDDYIFDYIRENRPAWLYGMVYGPWTKRGIKEIREDLPKQYEMRHFPEICHPRWCQYPVPEWDRVFSIVWPRNQSIYMMPSMMNSIYNATRENTIGSLPYNHTGVYNDLNKFVWSASAWDPEESVESILERYAKLFFSYDFIKIPGISEVKNQPNIEQRIEIATQMVLKGLQLLEQNWTGPLKDNTSTEEALSQWQIIADGIGGPQNNWRVEMFLYKARIDAQIKRKYDFEMQLEKKAYSFLSEASEIGIKKAIDLAKAELAKIETDFQSKDDFISECKSMGLSDKFGDFPDIANNIYSAFNDRYWLEKELESAKTIEQLSEIINYEDPGEGGFYDNLGVADEQPHLVKVLRWEEDPGFVYSSIEWVNNSADSDNRHSQLTHALSRYDSKLVMRWENLDKEAYYKIVVVYNGPFGAKTQCYSSEGIRIHDFLESTKSDRLSFPVPNEATKDGVLELHWTQELEDITRGVSVSEIWLKKDLH